MPLTRRVGSQDLAWVAIRPWSYWPQPSLNVTHMMIEGLLACSSIICFISRSYWARASALGLRSDRIDGMSCQTIRPSLSAQ